jgi:pimeloyl-ACP methyl ester carboxylesterase
LQTIKLDNLAVETVFADAASVPCSLLFIHGAGGTGRYWSHYLSYFGRRGWNAFALSLRGHSPSDREEGLAQITLEDYLDDVDKVLQRLNLRRVVLIGHSLGGLIAQKASENRPSVAALVTLCSAPPLGIAMALHDDAPYAGMIIKTLWGLMNMKPVKTTFSLAEKTLLNNIEPERRKDVFDLFVAESLVVGYQVAQGYPVNPGRIACPKLVVGCGRDRVAPPEQQKALAAFLGADYREYPHLAHLPMLETDWKTVASDIASWLIKNVEG